MPAGRLHGLLAGYGLRWGAQPMVGHLAYKWLGCGHGLLASSLANWVMCAASMVCIRYCEDFYRRGFLFPENESFCLLLGSMRLSFVLGLYEAISGWVYSAI